MTPEPNGEPAPERAYPYHSGWRAMACGALFFGILGGAGTAMLPFGCEQHRAGRLPLAVALWVIGLFGLPMILFAVFAIFAGIRDAISPPLVRVTPGSLLLPGLLRQRTCEDEKACEEDGKDNAAHSLPTHPEVIPFSTIRWVRREATRPGNGHRLMIVHDLSPLTLVIEDVMMSSSDFDELETVLRTAIPTAFASAPTAT